MNLPEYEAYKESGISWIGKLPAHWNSLRIKTLFELMKRPPRDEDGVVTAFRDGQVTLRSNRRTEGFTNSLQEIGYQGVRRGDLIIHAMDAFAGAIGVSDSDGKSTPVYSVCRPKLGLSDSRYYGRLLRHMALSGFIESLAKGIRERSTEFRWAEAGNVYLPVPPIAEQIAIAAFVDRETAKIDVLIAEQEKLVMLLEEKRHAAISHAVTKGLNPNALMKDSGLAWLGDVPAHWDVKKLRYLLKRNGLIRGPFGGDLKKEIFVDKGIKVYEQKNAIHKNFQAGDSYITAGKFSEMKRFSVAAGDYIMSCSGTIGKIYRIPSDAPPGIINQALLILRFENCLVEAYIDWLLIADFFLSQIIDNSQGGAMKNLVGMDVFTSISLPLPPAKEQYDIANHLNAEIKNLDKLVAEAEHGIALLQERRSALIAAAVTGQIDVRGAVSKAGVYSLESIAA